jgi:phosphate transport system substrate-binding protein
MKLMQTALAGVIGALFAISAQAADITGAGSTFAAPIYTKWADAYQKTGGGKVNYQGIGSSGGIKQIIAKTVENSRRTACSSSRRWLAASCR